MSPEKATYRYFRVFVPAICVYAAGTMGITWAEESASPLSGTRYLLAAVPIIAIYVAFWAHWRFAIDIDEFLRLIQIKGTLFGIASVMVVAAGWGTMEMLANVPRLSLFWLLPIFWIAQSVATVVISKREGVF